MLEKGKVLILHGPQGSGKGLLAVDIARKRGVYARTDKATVRELTRLTKNGEVRTVILDDWPRNRTTWRFLLDSVSVAFIICNSRLPYTAALPEYRATVYRMPAPLDESCRKCGESPPFARRMLIKAYTCAACMHRNDLTSRKGWAVHRLKRAAQCK